MIVIITQTIVIVLLILFPYLFVRVVTIRTRHVQIISRKITVILI